MLLMGAADKARDDKVRFHPREFSPPFESLASGNRLWDAPAGAACGCLATFDRRGDPPARIATSSSNRCRPHTKFASGTPIYLRMLNYA